ncbi:hypothetical protein C1645_827979 [Glomus cerebriforme]|uniref:Uncharacterized protein n=1 Tax=Glomus cerebriforme TaxID=658196 RepID=A0A397SMQ5_9GLOM|nr:hypothetical protein C1645_827979 [Glomus cerebriforme]
MISERQKYLENLLYKWFVLDCQPLYLLKSPTFHQFIYALNESFEFPNSKEFRKRIFEVFDFTKNQLIQYIQENANSVGKGLLTAKILIARAKRLINFFTLPKQNKHLIDVQKNSDKNLKKSDLHSVFYKAITDVKTHWSNAKEDAKRLKRINLNNEEWNIIKDFLEILGLFAKLIEKLEDLNTNDNAFEEHQFEEDDEDDESEARQKIKINIPVNIFGLLNNVKANLYKALKKYYKVIEKKALITALLDSYRKKITFANNY